MVNAGKRTTRPEPKGEQARKPDVGELTVSKLRTRTLKRLRGGYGAAARSAETHTSDCSCSCPEV